MQCGILGSRSFLESLKVELAAVGLSIVLHSLWTFCVVQGSMLMVLCRQLVVDPVSVVVDDLRVVTASTTQLRRPSVAPPLWSPGAVSRGVHDAPLTVC